MFSFCELCKRSQICEILGISGLGFGVWALGIVSPLVSAEEKLGGAFPFEGEPQSANPSSRLHGLKGNGHAAINGSFAQMPEAIPNIFPLHYPGIPNGT